MTYMKNLLATFLLSFLLMPCIGQAQEKGNGVESFTVSVPERIVQGEPFEVTYTLKATHWSKGKPQAGNGLMLMDTNYQTTSHDTYFTLVTTATYLTSRSGSVELPRMIVIVDDKEVLSDTKQITVGPHPEYGEEMTYAHQWLVKNGQNADSTCLSMDGGEQDMLLFSDRYHKCFAVVARKAVWPLVGEPMLAYGVGTIMPNSQEDPDNYEDVLQPFRLQIAALKATVDKASQAIWQLPYQPRNEAVEPLLGNRQWGQGEPYNVKTQALGAGNAWIGCVPLAMTMTMGYYRWPEKGVWHTYYKKGGTVSELDFTRCQPDWQNYRDSYDKEDATAAESLSELLVTIGLAVDANFGQGVTSANILNVKRALCNNLGYSGKMTIATDLTEAQTMALVYRELDNGRPCIVSHGSHAFVCDGYKGAFLHYNFGWNGYFNGYYRLKLGSQENTSGQRRILIKELVCGIEPQRGEVRREVTLAAAGTLSATLSQADKENATHLKVSGPLGSDDIRLLRKMAGAPDSLDFSSWQGGALTHLDLTDARIVTDAAAYLTKKANGKWTHWEEVDGQRTERVYDFSQMDLDSWNHFVVDIGNSQKGVVYTRTDDNRYFAHYSCQADSIGMFMFNECSSLQGIELPATTIRVGDHAFGKCRLLQTIRIPSSVKEIGWYSFNNCSSLEKIEVPQTAVCKSETIENCSPVLTGFTRY